MLLLKNFTRDVLKRPHPILSKVAEDITSAELKSESLKQLVTGMFEVMEAKSGAGLAAPQVGVSKRVIVYGFRYNSRYPNEAPIALTCMINPVIVSKSVVEDEFEEGCLSVPDYRGIVSRPSSIYIHAFSQHGEKIERELKNFEARVVMHEIDHLDGILFPERALKMRAI